MEKFTYMQDSERYSSKREWYKNFLLLWINCKTCNSIQNNYLTVLWYRGNKKSEFAISKNTKFCKRKMLPERRRQISKFLRFPRSLLFSHETESWHRVKFSRLLTWDKFSQMAWETDATPFLNANNNSSTQSIQQTFVITIFSLPNCQFLLSKHKNSIT